MLESIKKCMTMNKTLAKYDFRNNDLRDDGKSYILLLLTFLIFSRYIFHGDAWSRGRRKDCTCNRNRDLGEKFW